MTTTLAKLRDQHVKAAEDQWGAAVEDVKYLLNYKDEDVRKLTKMLIALDGSIRFKVFGGMYYQKIHAYGPAFEPCSILEQIRYLVLCEILDDGEPGIAYAVYDSHEGAFVSCSPDKENAFPYFYQGIDYLRETNPEAKCLNIERAIEVLQWHIDEKEETKKDPMFDEEDLASLEPTARDLEMAKLAEELSNL